jgi:drug/metabolite transporter (DMT)-like permease
MNIAATTKSKNASQISQGYGICILGTMLWSFTAVFIRYLTESYHMPSLVLAFWRDLVVCIALSLAFLIAKSARLRIERRHLQFLIAYGFVLSIFNSLWTISVSLNGAAVSTVLAYSSAAFTAVLAWRLFGERLGKIKILLVSLSILGCAFVSGAYDPSQWQVNPIGMVTGLLSGIAFASYSLMGKAAAQRGINPWTTLLYTFGFGSVFILTYNFLPNLISPASPLPNLFWLGKAVNGWVVLIILGLVPTIGGYGLYSVSLTYLPASVANLIATMEPAMTAGLAYLFLGERFSGSQLIGSALVLGSVIALRLTDEPGQAEQPA